MEKENRSIKINKFLKLYIIPLIAVVGFFSVIIFMVFPKLSEILTNLDKINENSLTFESKTRKLNTLQALANNINSLNLQLNTINQIAPNSTSEVVKFRDKITLIIKKNNLVINSQRLSEISSDNKTVQNASANGSIILQEVPFEFEVTGSYGNIVDFINNLSLIDDFIIIKQMQLNAGTTSSNIQSVNWSFKLSIVKYQFRTAKADEFDKIYIGVDPTIQVDKNVLDYINSRIQTLQ